MCCRNCTSNCVLAFGIGVMISSFFDKGIALFLVGVAAVILAVAIRER